jgi:hypothetical protein
MVNDDMECTSTLCRSDDCLKLGDSATGVDILSKNVCSMWERPQK